ncbi:3-mercaptopyruvate sulfurtransferase [Asticcacaulis sp. EMRT-3]|uniref:3-mercaptopyruvate sulfurtransferase n=1 Tax=Asticcacaulis sp. EMRT-3 TaxID=3040349 RepID=UPI0024AF95BE|nr:3-mercaptopyruvate sulfurtransferase [Asticcacaulis sp. EMRT-3]MDI7774479.1 3-mercaptopyruvate sulfurtransferase [Asticcacaulis sp. EMRT-3]
MTSQMDVLTLKALMDKGAVKVIDGSWALDGTDMRALYEASHLPGAQFFDLEAISDHTTPLPHMAPSPEAFAAAVSAMGIAAEDQVVIYDRQGLFSAARVWWTFRLMGHENVQVLRGGLPAWQAAGLPLDHGTPEVQPTTYRPQFQPQWVIDVETVKSKLNAPGTALLDARPKPRFDGLAAEPRPGLRSGHMPGSCNLPFGLMISDGALKSDDEIRTILKDSGVPDKANIITSCGSGVTAAILSMALFEIGRTARLYDGSWAEWGQVGLDTPVVEGHQAT